MPSSPSVGVQTYFGLGLYSCASVQPLPWRNRQNSYSRGAIPPAAIVVQVIEFVLIAGKPASVVSDDTMGTVDGSTVNVSVPRQSSKAAVDPVLRAQTCRT